MRNSLMWSLGTLLMLAGCSAEAASESYRGGDGASSMGTSDGDGFSGISEGGGPTSSGEPGTTPGGGTEPQPGTLTAGVWDDNRNYEHFTGLLDDNVDSALPVDRAEHEAARDQFADTLTPHARLDIALVIDTTGSMGDEIRYLQSEIDAIAAAVDSEYPDADARWSLIVYRDDDDEYVTRVFDFRDVGAIRSDLADQSAGGGGDFPEASHAGLTDMTTLDWRTDEDVARLAFWVADAPHHMAQTGVLTDAIRAAAALDVHIYPIASSGVDLRTEVSMRSAAQLTGGRYLFLTDDSGVGGAHLEPTVPCYFVTLLSNAMLRMIGIEMGGVYLEPATDQIIRTGGDPTDGACTLEDGGTVLIF